MNAEIPERLTDDDASQVASAAAAPTPEELSAPQRASTPSPSTQSQLLELPSRGLFYGDATPGGTVEVLPIRAGVEKRLAGSRGQMSSIIETLIRMCVQTDALKPEDWLVNDAFYLLLMLRANTYGSAYRFPVRCTGCQENFEANIEIPDDFVVRFLEPGTTEPFGPVTLPVSGDDISYRLLRRKDEKDIVRYTKQEQRRQRGEDSDPGYIYRLALRIQEINGDELDIGSKLEYVEQLHGADSVELRNYMDDNDPGVDTTAFVECVACGYENEEVMPITAEFFRPRTRRR